MPPGITSAPSTSAYVGEAYAYAVLATDPEGDPLTFSLSAAPAGMTIDSQTGFIQWAPELAQVGDRDVAVIHLRD